MKLSITAPAFILLFFTSVKSMNYYTQAQKAALYSRAPNVYADHNEASSFDEPIHPHIVNKNLPYIPDSTDFSSPKKKSAFLRR